MRGEATDVQIAGFAVALRAKGETVEEISGLVQAMYEHANTIDVPGPTVDIVGTGGDRAKTVNISTMSAIVVAGTGAKVVKHGNRAASSASGASDVLGKLGVNLELTPQRVAEVAAEAGSPSASRSSSTRRCAMSRRSGRVGHRHPLQLPRPADQPRAGAGAGDRRRRRADGADHRRRAGRTRLLRTGLPRATTASTS